MHGQYQLRAPRGRLGSCRAWPRCTAVAFGYTHSGCRSLREARQIRAAQENVHSRLEADLVVRVETVLARAVEIQHPEQALAVNQGHDELRAGRGVAGDVPRERVDVRDDDGPSLTSSAAA